MGLQAPCELIARKESAVSPYPPSLPIRIATSYRPHAISRTGSTSPISNPIGVSVVFRSSLVWDRSVQLSDLVFSTMSGSGHEVSIYTSSLKWPGGYVPIPDRGLSEQAIHHQGQRNLTRQSAGPFAESPRGAHRVSLPPRVFGARDQL